MKIVLPCKISQTRPRFYGKAAFINQVYSNVRIILSTECLAFIIGFVSIVVSMASTVGEVLARLCLGIICISGIVTLTGTRNCRQKTRILSYWISTNLVASFLVFKIISISIFTAEPKSKKYFIISKSKLGYSLTEIDSQSPIECNRQLFTQHIRHIQCHKTSEPCDFHLQV